MKSEEGEIGLAQEHPPTNARVVDLRYSWTVARWRHRLYTPIAHFPDRHKNGDKGACSNIVA